jgi:hypothetical protein
MDHPTGCTRALHRANEHCELVSLGRIELKRVVCSGLGDQTGSYIDSGGDVVVVGVEKSTSNNEPADTG